MKLQKTINWIDPLEVASSIDEECWALLYSGFQNDFTGRYSILAIDAKEKITGNSFAEFASRLGNNKEKFDNSWFGYLGYGLKNDLEKLPQDEPFGADLPDLFMVNYGTILLFDHDEQKIEIWSDASSAAHIERFSEQGSRKKNWEGCKISNLSSNMTKNEYLKKVEQIKQAIKRGDLYQANLTRKFFGKIKDAQPFDIFAQLCAVSPAPYSSFLKFGDKYIVSSSPERFLHISKDGDVDTRPIKGTAPRFDDEKQDELSKTNLQNSEKDRAENLMIVDLSRNDISRGCVTGSVKTSKLFEVTSYATVHHMASTVTGQKRDDVAGLDLVKACFPPGSMTGAPKIKAMQLCSELEKVKRGVYSGSIGWFGGDGSVDLSVVIRTLIIDGDNFQFQVGGAIIADSKPESEWEETLTKAKAISKVLGVDVSGL